MCESMIAELRMARTLLDANLIGVYEYHEVVARIHNEHAQLVAFCHEHGVTAPCETR